MSKEAYTPGGSGKTYLKIVKTSNGDTVFAEKSSPENPMAVRRDFTAADKKEYTFYELLYKSISGVVQDVRIDTEGEYGKKLEVFLRNADEVMVLSLQMDSSYMRDFIGKSLHMEKGDMLKISPFDFIAKPTAEYPTERRLIGFTIQINGIEKVKAKKLDDKMFPGAGIKMPIYDQRNENGGNPDELDVKEYAKLYDLRRQKWYERIVIPAYRKKYGMDVAGVASAEIQTAKEKTTRQEPPEQEEVAEDDLPF